MKKLSILLALILTGIVAVLLSACSKIDYSEKTTIKNDSISKVEGDTKADIHKVIFLDTHGTNQLVLVDHLRNVIAFVTLEAKVDRLLIYLDIQVKDVIPKNLYFFIDGEDKMPIDQVTNEPVIDKFAYQFNGEIIEAFTSIDDKRGPGKAVIFNVDMNKIPKEGVIMVYSEMRRLYPSPAHSWNPQIVTWAKGFPIADGHAAYIPYVKYAE